MKSAAIKTALALLCCLAAPLESAAQSVDLPPTAPPLLERPLQWNEAERSWDSLRQEIMRVADTKTPPDQIEVISRSRAVANGARNFYLAHPQHAKAAEARRVEILSLIDAAELGDEREALRLSQCLVSLRQDHSVPVEQRAAAVAAYEFTRALRSLKGAPERMDATVKVARQIASEFPGEPQAYAALLAVAKASPREKAEPIAREVLASDAPASQKAEAQMLLDRHALVGRALASVLGEAELTAGRSLPNSTPVIVYSWATWGPGSIELGRMIQARRFSAIGVCLDENTGEALKVERLAGLGGMHCYDTAGSKGKLAERFGFSTAGQIYLVDDKGVIRDIRGGEDLENKLTALGFRTPVINPTDKELRP